ncbi:MAG: sialidase family protein [Pirellulaceae bacterium]|jgi:hypothetical protein|nr:sialidase family protein [Pirellulaceae bacterium]MDP7014874.1 sialidase family protein [Pirellulaceae bacterium]
MEVVSRAVVYDASTHAPQPRIAYFTSLCQLRSGDILCGYQVGPTKHGSENTVAVSRSRDGGATWSGVDCQFETTVDGVPGSLAAAEMVEVEPGRLLCFTTWFDRSDPNRPLYNPETEGILRSKQLVAVSTDSGATWGDWREVPTPGLTGCATTGPALRFPDGLIAFAFESFKEFDDPEPARHAAWVIATQDGGETFGEPLLVGRDPRQAIYYWDQRLCRLSGAGEAAALFWTHDRSEQRDLRVHFTTLKLTASNIEVAEIRETNIPGQIASPAQLSDGRLLGFVVDRNRPGSMTLWQSADGGQSWPAEQKLLVHTQEERGAVTQGLENIDFDQYWEDMSKWTFGHPAIEVLPDDRALLAWYAGSPGCMSIHACIVQM